MNVRESFGYTRFKTEGGAAKALADMHIPAEEADQYRVEAFGPRFVVMVYDEDGHKLGPV